VVTITAMRRCEKRQITDENATPGPTEIDLDRFASNFINSFAARSDP